MKHKYHSSTYICAGCGSTYNEIVDTQITNCTPPRKKENKLRLIFLRDLGFSAVKDPHNSLKTHGIKSYLSFAGV